MNTLVLYTSVFAFLFNIFTLHAGLTKTFDEVKASMKHACSSTALENAKQYIDKNDVTSAQVKEMMASVSFDSYKLELAKYAYPHTVDKKVYLDTVGEQLFGISKRELNDYIQKIEKSSCKKNECPHCRCSSHTLCI